MAEPAAPQWPDLFSDSAADPAKSAAPARHETNPAPCVGAASCQKAGGGTTRAGESEAHGRRLQFEAAARDARDNTASSITGAVKMLKRLESVAALSGSSGEAAHVAADQRLVKRAQEALGPVQRGTFTFNDAQKAYDPGVRTELTFAAESASQSDDFTQESGRLKKAEGEFHGLALESDQRVGALGSRFAVDSSLVGAPGSSASREFVSRSSLGAEARGASSVLGLLGIGGGGRGHSPALESPKAEFESWPGSHGRASADSLRDRLKHNLAAKTHGEALDATAFGADGLAPVPLAGPMTSAIPNAPEDALASAFRGIRDSAFALGSPAEIEAEMHRLMRDPSSLPGMESGTLFERVHRAHKACEERACVLARTP